MWLKKLKSSIRFIVLIKVTAKTEGEEKRKKNPKETTEQVNI